MVAGAASGVLLRTHDAGGILARQFEQIVDALDEPGALHDFGIADLMQVLLRFAGDSVVYIAQRVFRATTQCFTCPGIGDTVCEKSLREDSFVELRMEATVGSAAYVHQVCDRMSYQQPDKFVHRAVAVTDGVELHAAVYIPTSATAA
jgi:hypothetical protein